MKTYTILIFSLLAPMMATAQTLPKESDMLFRLSCDNGLVAEVHQGEGAPNFVNSISLIEDGAIGKAFHCNGDQLLTYRAAGNIYAQRGTLSFWWRAGEPLTDIEFPVWRVSYADHSSWDMVWMRIDYNGQGFDAFVTDNGLSRVRVSWKPEQRIDANHWYHLVFTWDENVGVALWVDGQEVARKLQKAVLDTGLDQMGPHSRVISPYQVQSAYTCVRGGDIDEVRVYATSLLNDKNAAQDLQEAWIHRYGFEQEAPALAQKNTVIRKVQIQKAYDEKRWYWKGCDGILETTWPGVYNRSRLPGRFDYVQLPDWDCYSTSGRRVRFVMPDEPWNQVELTGSAYGQLGVSTDTLGNDAKPLTSIAQGTHHTSLRLNEAIKGQTITFTNDQPEEPIQELDAYYIHEGEAPEGICRLSYRVSPWQSFDNPRLTAIEKYIDGRHPEGERQKLLALPDFGGRKGAAAYTGTGPIKGELRLGKQKGNEAKESQVETSWPIVHVVIPNDIRDLTDYRVPELNEDAAQKGASGLATVTRAPNYGWRYMQGGLDGIVLHLPKMDKATQLNLQVKDPIWPLRNMMNVTFSVPSGEEHDLWLDLRDRILPNDKPLYLSLAFSNPDINASELMGMTMQLVFKPLAEAKKEHIEDRLTQIIDSHAMLVEEGTSSRKLDKYLQVESDLEDLLRVDPENELGRCYWYHYNGEQAAPAYTEPKLPEGVPEWASLQLRLLSEYRGLLEWYIDNRQIENGEFGGGLSDDTDLGNLFPGLILNGCIPEKATESLHRMLEAIYEQGMLTRGMSTLMTDGLHTYEEGVNTIVQCNLAEQGNPKQVERMMEAARSVRDWLLGHNQAGHLHFTTDYFSATRKATEGVWTWSSPREFLHLSPACTLGELYGDQEARRYIIEFGESLLAHATTGRNGGIVLPSEINFVTDETRLQGGAFSTMVLWYCYLWTGEEKFLKPLLSNPSFTQLHAPLDEQTAAKQCRKQLEDIAWRRFMMREGSVWIDRVYFSCDDIQRQRMGGIALNRGSFFAPSNSVSWHYPNAEQAEKVAILVTKATRDSLEITFWNTDGQPAQVEMTGMEVLNGDWNVNGKTQAWGRNQMLPLTLPARSGYKLSMALVGQGSDGSLRPDLAIGREDIVVAKNGRKISVTVHNLGSVDAPATRLAVVDGKGDTLAQTEVPALAAPVDLMPSRTTVTVECPKGADLSSAKVVINPVGEIYEGNNTAYIF